MFTTEIMGYNFGMHVCVLFSESTFIIVTLRFKMCTDHINSFIAGKRPAMKTSTTELESPCCNVCCGVWVVCGSFALGVIDKSILIYIMAWRRGIAMTNGDTNASWPSWMNNDWHYPNAENIMILILWFLFYICMCFIEYDTCCTLSAMTTIKMNNQS